MKLKYFLGSVLSFIVSISAFAQSSPGYDYLSLGEFKLAKEYFTKNLSSSPAESHFYLGEIAYQEGKMAEAKSEYEKALAANLESPYGAIGLAKLELKAEPKEAAKTLNNLQKKNKKDVFVGIAVAKAFFENGMKEDAQKAILEARKADKKSPYTYIFEGDMLAKENKIGDAAQQYDQAIYNDANCVLAYMKGAEVYEFINPTTATELLTKAISIRPEYKIAYKDLGDLNYRKGIYANAIPAYKEFFTGGDYTIDDMRRYAGALFFTGNFNDAKVIIAEGLGRDANDFVLNRLLMYSLNDTEDFQKGLEVGNKFFSLPVREGVDTVKYIPQDYLIYGNLLSENGDKKAAIEQFKKAVELDPTKLALFKTIASASAAEKDFESAAEYYSQYVQMAGETAAAEDYFQLGGYYTSAGAKLLADTVTVDAKTKGHELLKKAESSYDKVIELKPDSYLGHYMKTRPSYHMDPSSEEGLSRPHYEKTIEILLTDPEPNKAVLIEAYSYLSFYYYLQFDKHKKAEDKAKVKEYAEKVLELDPENGNGKQLFDWASGK